MLKELRELLALSLRKQPLCFLRWFLLKDILEEGVVLKSKIEGK